MPGFRLLLVAAGQWPNLVSRVLKLICARLAQDWQEHFGHPVLALETFVDPQPFHGTRYKAAGWKQLGSTQGYQRNWQDFYTDTKHPKKSLPDFEKRNHRRPGTFIQRFMSG